MPMTAEQAEAYLRTHNHPEDRWLLVDERPWWLISQIGDSLFGLNEQTIRQLLETGAIPNGVKLSQQAGWRIPRSGLLLYLARVRQEQEQRRA